MSNCRSRLLSAAALVCLLAGSRPASAQNNDWTEPFPAFRIAGNLYYIGSKGLASYLVTTPEGHVLINSEGQGTKDRVIKSAGRSRTTGRDW